MVAAAREQEIRTLAGLIRDIKIAMLTTAAPDGTLRSRPMATQRAPFDGDLWFLTAAGSGAAGQARAAEQVSVSYADPEKHTYVSVSGSAVVYYDRQKAEELWTPAHRAWFPKGLDDPDLAVLKVRVEHAQYWTSQAPPVVQLYGLIKALATGHRAAPGKTERIDLQRPDQ